MSDEGPWLTRKQAAARLGVNERTISRWVREGRLARVQFRRSDLDAQRREGRPGGTGPQSGA